MEGDRAQWRSARAHRGLGLGRCMVDGGRWRRTLECGPISCGRFPKPTRLSIIVQINAFDIATPARLDGGWELGGHGNEGGHGMRRLVGFISAAIISVFGFSS